MAFPGYALPISLLQLIESAAVPAGAQALQVVPSVLGWLLNDCDLEFNPTDVRITALNGEAYDSLGQALVQVADVLRQPAPELGEGAGITLKATEDLTT